MAKRRLTRRQRQVRRNRIILACAAAALLIIIIVIISVSMKGCSKSKNTDKNTESTTAKVEESTQNTENESTSEAAASTSADNSSATMSDITSASNSSEFAPPVVPSGNVVSKGTTSKGFKIQEINGATYIDGVLIANKTYALPQDFIPTNPDQPVNADRSSTCLDKTLMSAWNTMLKDATANGLNIYIASGYRSYNYQVNVYNRYVKSDGVALADTYSSRPGNSEHQTGLCFDLNSIEDSFQYTNEGKWVNDNCYKYGFCIRFPKGKDSATGYQYESWHLRYVGVDLATKLYNNGDWLSLEEYFGITSEYPN
ncbi:MAG: M15 family metallopeptidase [Eubacteriales bacterium]|nr:M15 family metallopeptidase [Eubacteriales bacterium]